MHGLLRTEGSRKAVAAAFAASRNLEIAMKGCCSALYVIAAEIKKPTDVDDPVQYWHLDWCYSIPVQAFVDIAYHFTHVSITFIGYIHESLSFASSSLAIELESGFFHCGIT